MNAMNKLIDASTIARILLVLIHAPAILDTAWEATDTLAMVVEC